MSNFDQLKSQFTTGFDGLLPTISEALNQLFRKEFKIEIDVSEATDLQSLFSAEEFPRVNLQFSTVGKSNYQHRITLSPDFTLKLYAWMIDAEPDESVTDDHLEGLQEGANQLFGQIQAVLDGEDSAFTVEDLKSLLVETQEDGTSDLPEKGELGVTYNITIEEESFPVQHYMWFVPGSETVSDEKSIEESDIENILDESLISDDLLDADIALDEASQEEMIGVNPADFDSFTSNGSGNGHPRNMDMLMDVGLEALVVLGKKTMLIREILKLGKGSVVELDKAAGEPLEIFVNRRKLAEGEVVVIDDHFGIRITQLVGPKERIKSLG